jgi:hypothetical protein
MLTLRLGGQYRNGRGDLLGPLVDAGHGLFADQYGGGPYRADGRQMCHTERSTGNIVIVDETPCGCRAQRARLQEMQRRGAVLGIALPDICPRCGR